MYRIHFICREGLNLKPIRFPEFESGYWDITSDDASTLIGGMIYLHETKATPSYFGGTVKNYRIEEIDQAHSKRIVFTVLSQKAGKCVPWEGDQYSMAWTSGIVPEELEWDDTFDYKAERSRT